MATDNNSWHGFHGFKNQDTSGQYINHNQPNKKKRIMIAIAGLMALSLIIFWLVGRFTGGISQNQTDLNAIIGRQKQIVTTIDTYNSDLKSLSSQTYAAQTKAVISSSSNSLDSQYRKLYGSNSNFSTATSKNTSTALDKARSDGKLDSEFIVVINALIAANRDSMSQLHDTTESQNLKNQLNDSYNNFGSLIE